VAPGRIVLLRPAHSGQSRRCDDARLPAGAGARKLQETPARGRVDVVGGRPPATSRRRSPAQACRGPPAAAGRRA